LNSARKYVKIKHIKESGVLNMAKISKDTIPEHTKNIKINTRIMITSVLAIIIPIIIISTAASIFFYTSKDKYDFTSVTAKSYTVINQIQWSQTVNEISANLVNDKEPDRKLSDLKKSFQPLEKLGTMIYIEQNGSEYYSTGSKEKILEEAQSIAKTDITKNSYYYGENGVSVIAHAQNENESYLIVIANGDYDVPDITTSASPQSVIIKLANNTVAIFSLCIAIFIIAIIIISLITSKTIVGPIEKITRGADEIAKGNLDYEIDYKSTNELGRLAQSFNEMRIKVKDSIEQKNKSDQQQKEMIAGIAHDLRTPLTSIKG
jgi:nitrogen fixation/metabolism regulation signal transduction histidine kinase